MEKICIVEKQLEEIRSQHEDARWRCGELLAAYKSHPDTDKEKCKKRTWWSNPNVYIMIHYWTKQEIWDDLVAQNAVVERYKEKVHHLEDALQELRKAAAGCVKLHPSL